MKTGRVRRKAQRPPEEKPEAVKPEARPKTRKRPSVAPRPGISKAGRRGPGLIGCLAVAVIGAILLIVILMLVFGGKGGAEEWVKATRANGSWMTSVVVFGPQVAVQERWQADCIDDPHGSVRAGTCTMRETNAYSDTVVDDYEEYAYNIYYEESWDRLYQAQGTEFVVTSLGSDEWWEDDLHYTRAEELDRDSCTYSSYTLWVDDPDDAAQEMEVYLSECEVWDHVTVSQRVYEQKTWCQCDVVSLVQLGTVHEQGAGTRIVWPNASVPSGGRTEEAFEGQITFLGDDYTYTVTTEDPAKYQRYLTGDYYIGLRDGRPVTISASPPE